MGIFIDRVKIANFRAIKRLEVSLSPFTVLVGTNNSGKTTFLRALHLALGEGRKTVSKEDFHIDKGVPAEEIVIDIRIVPIDDKYVRTENFGDPWFPGLFVESQIRNEGDREYIAFRTRIASDTRKSGGYSFERVNLKQWDDSSDWPDKNQEGDKTQFLEPIPLYFIDAQRDILQDLREKGSFLGRLSSRIHFDKKKIAEIEKLLADLNSNIVNESEVLKHLADRLAELSDTIGTKRAGIEITPIHKKIRDIGKGLNIHLAEGDTESLPLDYHGMGTRSWASLLAIKAFVSWEAQESRKDDEPFHSILALEEPESHLHPNAQRHLFSQIMQMGGQKIISTHSPFIASRSNLADIRHFYKIDKGSAVGQISNELGKDEIKKIEREIMNTRGELLFAKAVVLCEGITEEQMLPIFAEAHWGKSHFEKGICFAGTGSGTNYGVFISFCRSFNIPWFIFGDSESGIVQRIDEALAKLGLQKSSELSNIILLPSEKNIEEYLVDSGYQNELKNAIFELQKDACVNNQHREAKEKEVTKMDAAAITQFLESKKAKIAPYVAEAIIQSSDDKKRIPAKFLELFQEIDKTI